MLKFGTANAKLQKLEKKIGGKIATFSILSGTTCPYAKSCASKVIVKNNKRHIEDGKYTEFRCFSASQEALFTNVYNSRKTNTENVIKLLQQDRFVEQFLEDMPKGISILRWHVAGDAKTQKYFDAMIEIANRCPQILFYSYTKSLPFWIKRINEIPQNLILTASYGGHRDDLIEKYNLRYAKVVYSKYEAKKLLLPIDHDDSHAIRPVGNFALLIHGQMPKGSKLAKRWAKRKKTDGYSKEKRLAASN